ncbi:MULTISPECIES: hypothetical protein [Exiguobacterium]|uniref:hypothetical protein n=1 Tax=Exiguobacterium TaxID=33986 RepID=UPI00047D2252|nr:MULTISPECIES: hypothetical protein [Exiguobacterium]MCK2157315.1 hypothetical protein [Exiguobacterium sp. 17-1]
MFNKLIAAGLTAIVTSGLIISISYIRSALEALDDDLYFSIFLFYTLSSFPVILISGILADFFVKRIAPFFSTNRNIFLLKAIVYVVFGCMIALFLLFLDHEGNYTFSDLNFVLLAGVSAFLYFLFSFELQRRKRSIP